MALGDATPAYGVGVIIVAGEALVDLVADEGPAALDDRVRYTAIPGGSPANVAVGLARLGAPVELLARLATDGFGRLLRAHLDANGVGLSFARVAQEPTTLAVVSVDGAGAAAYDFYVQGTADWQWRPEELPAELPAAANALCTGSLAVALEPGASVLRSLLRRERERGALTIVVDPNVRPALMGSPQEARRLVEELVALADVVKASEEDLHYLAPGEQPTDIVRTWATLGPALVVLTRGQSGAYAVAAGGTAVALPARPIRVVDTVGAGDAFTAGLLDGLRLAGLLGRPARDRLGALDETTLTAVLDRARLVAALTCGRSGADPPTAAELTAAG